jgi:hypothetical protein
MQSGISPARKESGGGGCGLLGIETLILLFMVRRFRKS